MKPEWMKHGSCQGLPTELFFPEKGNHVHLKKAQAVCAGCPVNPQCLEYALEEAQKVELLGIWAGTSQKVRIKMLREKGLTPSRRLFREVA